MQLNSEILTSHYRGEPIKIGPLNLGNYLKIVQITKDRKIADWIDTAKRLYLPDSVLNEKLYKIYDEYEGKSKLEIFIESFFDHRITTEVCKLCILQHNPLIVFTDELTEEEKEPILKLIYPTMYMSDEEIEKLQKDDGKKKE